MAASAETLAGRIAIITGASSGIGLAIARQLAANGCRSVLNARRAPTLNDVVNELNRNIPHLLAIGVPGDCADEAAIQQMFLAARSSFGAVPDLVVVNAGRGLAGSVVTSDPEEWEEMIRTNLLGAARLIRAAAHAMLGTSDPAAALLDPDWLNRSRDIVVIGSVVGRHVSPYSSMYGSTKFGVHGLAEGVRRELGPKGIRVTLIEPGFVVSEFQGVAGYKDEWFRGVLEKLGPVLKPDDVARMVSFVCAQPAHVNVGNILIRPTRQEYP